LQSAPAPAIAPPDRPQERTAVTTPPVEPVPDVRVPDPPPAPPEAQFEELVVPVSSVIGLQVETPLSSERSRIEDRVDARVTRDVTAGGRIAIPSGSRVIGAVSLVERGGKMKGTARLGVRFHTLVLADGREVPLRTEAVYREGDSAGNESARKIGGAAIGGAILGAIMGGGKGAAIGGAAGAGAGSAAVMAGDRNAATLPAGTVVNVRLSAPATIEVEKR
jgi:type IV secretory pathway VirB10-like protein